VFKSLIAWMDSFFNQDIKKKLEGCTMNREELLYMTTIYDVSCDARK